ncbi:MAG: hypothetical protein JXR35_08775 [Rhodobacteraceae bacterium]|nr:hypothetical protein [Paracoccaceae bacterium]
MTKQDEESTANSEDTSSKKEQFDLDQFADAMSKPSPEEQAFFARRRELGLGVGLSEDGDLIYGRNSSKK